MKDEESHISKSAQRPPFPAFAARYGIPESQVTLDNSTVGALPRTLPAELLEHWRLFGFGSYDEGLTWTHPPKEFEAVIEEWTGLSIEEAVLLARFSFGDFVMWARRHVYFVNVHFGRIEELPSDPGFVFDEVLCDDTFLNSFVRHSLHQESVQRLGALTPHQCFAFVPALALGGTESVESVHKVTMREHLAFLAQLNGPIAIR